MCARQLPRVFATGASGGLSTAGCGGALMRLTQEKVSLSYPPRPKDRKMTKLMSALLAGAFAVSLTAAAQTYPPTPAPATPATPATPAVAPAKTEAKAMAKTDSMKSTGTAESKKAKKKAKKRATKATSAKASSAT